MDPLAYTLGEATEITKISRTSLWAAERRGEIHFVRHGRKVLVMRDELERFLRAGSTGRA